MTSNALHSAHSADQTRRKADVGEPLRPKCLIGGKPAPLRVHWPEIEQPRESAERAAKSDFGLGNERGGKGERAARQTRQGSRPPSPAMRHAPSIRPSLPVDVRIQMYEVRVLVHGGLAFPRLPGRMGGK